MKSYFRTYDELAASWVAGNCSYDAHTAKRRMFCEGNRIYSYGGHFKIAHKWQAPDTGREWFLLTERTYSPTTRTHIKAVCSAIPDCQRVYLPSVDDLGRDMAPASYKRLNPNFTINLARSDAKESDLGVLVLHHELSRLDESAGTYLRKLKPYEPECLFMQFESARDSVARFGLELPARVDCLREQCISHYHRRASKNAVQSLAA